MGAVLRGVLLRPGPVMAPPALSGGLVLRPFYVLAGGAVSCLQLVEARGKRFGTTGDLPIRPLLGRRLVLLAGDSASCLAPSFGPLLLRIFLHEVCQRPGRGTRHALYRS